MTRADCRLSGFSDEPAVTASIRVEGDRYRAQPFDASGRRTESSLDVGSLADWLRLDELFDHVRYVFTVDRIEG